MNEENQEQPTGSISDEQQGKGRPRVPYVTAWSPETDEVPGLIIRPGLGIGYSDETDQDRDRRGILLKRTLSAQGQGVPEFGKVHATRQRQAMTDLLCQVCGEPADKNDDGVLWLLRDHRKDWPCWPNRMACTEPPICAPCADHSVRACPTLRQGHVLVRVRRAPIVGVRGTLHMKNALGVPQAVEADIYAFDEPLIYSVLASLFVRELQDATLID